MGGLRKALVLDPRDNVAVALRDLRSGETVRVIVGNDVTDITLIGNVPFGHKFAIRDIRSGEYVVKFGEVIGVATTDIRVGEHVHTHNVSGLRGKGSKSVASGASR